MMSLIWITVWLLALAVGTAVVLTTQKKERRWATVGSLAVALAGAVGLGLSTSWGAVPVDLGPLHIDAVPVTVGPAMLLGAIALVLLSGRDEATGAEPGWLLATLALESVALLSGSFALLAFAEAGASALLARHASARGHRAHFAYLSVAALLLLVTGIGSAAGTPELAGPIAVVAVLAALIRLGILPFSTGMLASLQHGPTTATLMASLPFGGVLLLIRANPALNATPGIADAIVTLLLCAAPLSAAMTLTQKELGRSLGYLLAATHGLIAIGALDPSTSGQLGAELLWAGALLTVTGFGAACNLVCLRIGSPNLDRFHGLHASAPFLSLAFLILGVGVAGAPGTIEFVAEDILLNTASARGTFGMALVVATIALIGFNVLRLHFHVFFGVSLADRPYLRIKSRERLGLILVAAAVVLGGFAPSLLPLVSAAAAVAGL